MSRLHSNDGHRAGPPDNSVHTLHAGTDLPIAHHGADGRTGTTESAAPAPLAHLLSSIRVLALIDSAHSARDSDLIALLDRLQENVDDTLASLPRPHGGGVDVVQSIPPLSIPDRCTLGELGHWLSNRTRPRVTSLGHSVSCCVDDRVDSLPSPLWLNRLMMTLPGRLSALSSVPVTLDVHCSFDHRRLIVEIQSNDQEVLTSILGSADMPAGNGVLAGAAAPADWSAQVRTLPLWRCLAHLAGCCLMLDGMNDAHGRGRARLVIVAPIAKADNAADAGQIPQAV